MKYIVKGGVATKVSEREKLWHAVKYVAVIGLVSVFLAFLLIVAVKFCGVTGKTENGVTNFIGKVSEFLGDRTITAVEAAALAYILLVAFGGRLPRWYRWAKAGLVKCLLFFNIFPLTYFFSMFWKIDFVPDLGIAWVSPLMLVFGAFVVYLLPMDAPPQHEIEKKK